MCDERPSRKDYLPGNQRSNMTTKDARLSQLIVGVHTVPSYPLTSNRTREKRMKGINTPLSSVIDRVDSVYSKPNTDEYDNRTHLPISIVCGMGRLGGRM